MPQPQGLVDPGPPYVAREAAWITVMHASLALKAGIHPKIVSERLGHSSKALTMDV